MSLLIDIISTPFVLAAAYAVGWYGSALNHKVKTAWQTRGKE